MQKQTTFQFADDISVVLPESLNLITPYVIQEQGDWFEDEIKFVRIFLKPNKYAIDIGANYGLFTLSMAKLVGPVGKVWAFEPASSTAAYLAQSLSLNGFKQVVLDQRALSDKTGTAQLSLNENSELNELVRDAASDQTSETVALITMDQAMQQHGWQNIEFLKIDAEGEEAAIIRGGRNFFQTQSPLVLYEIKAGNSIHVELVRTFAEIGYASYRLVPGLNVLVPFNVNEAVDSYQLNLFCCKLDRAQTLAENGLLVLPDDKPTLTPEFDDHQRFHNSDIGSKYEWRMTLAELPYGKILTQAWQETTKQGKSLDIEIALALHARAHDQTLSAADRYFALQASFERLKAICTKNPSFLRLTSLARVAKEFGARSLAVRALDSLLQFFMKHQQADPTEPFLATSERFEKIDPKEALINWVICSVLEALETGIAFSSFYTGQSAIQRLVTIQNLGFGSPEMARRLKLVQQRFGLSSQ